MERFDFSQFGLSWLQLGAPFGQGVVTKVLLFQTEDPTLDSATVCLFAFNSEWGGGGGEGGSGFGY